MRRLAPGDDGARSDHRVYRCHGPISPGRSEALSARSCKALDHKSVEGFYRRIHRIYPLRHLQFQKEMTMTLFIVSISAASGFALCWFAKDKITVLVTGT